MTNRPNRIEILKQYEYEIEGLDHPVRARIVKAESVPPYCWQISHYYKGSKSAGTPYYPSVRCYGSMQEAEESLEHYARSFTNIDVEPSGKF